VSNIGNALDKLKSDPLKLKEKGLIPNSDLLLLTDIIEAESDPHFGGQKVLIITIQDRKLVYKPSGGNGAKIFGKF
jgi:lantibiotic modifying enzyme